MYAEVSKRPDGTWVAEDSQGALLGHRHDLTDILIYDLGLSNYRLFTIDLDPDFKES